MAQDYSRLRLLHTSDWHLGRTLYGRKRYDEFEAFLNWLALAIEEHHVDVLLVTGDVFDTSTPSNRAQELYYQFLCRVAASPCRHVVVVAGNHDSPSFLDAPRKLLRALNIHVVGALAEPVSDEVIILRGFQERPELIVCAVPHLRDRDIRTVEPGETINDKERKLVEGIAGHYADVVELAVDAAKRLGIRVPIVATGHLFAAGGHTADGDGVRELYIGSLAHVPAACFPNDLSYVALGHLHIAQKVNGCETIRYSGSPLPMSFGEASQQKQVLLADFDANGTCAAVVPIPVPNFQRLEHIKGTLDELRSRLRELVREDVCTWIEIDCEDTAVISNLRELLDEVVSDSNAEILRVRSNRAVDMASAMTSNDDILDSPSAMDVFERCLAANAVPDEQRPELIQTFQEILAALSDEDAMAG